MPTPIDPLTGELKDWLLAGDVAIRYQVWRDLLDGDRQQLPSLQNRIASEGWGARFLAQRHPDGHWGHGYYQPKWTSTHYTLQDLKNLSLPRDNPAVRATVTKLLDECLAADGGIRYSRHWEYSEDCISGMVLNFGSWFAPGHRALDSLVDYLLSVEMGDGGWNCQHYRGATHSSLHTTISVLEGLLEYCRSGGTHRLEHIVAAERRGHEFILVHRLYQSHRTGRIIRPDFLRLTWPSRWHYDILRALDYFQAAGVAYDPRMQPALERLLRKRQRDGTWPLQQNHPGQVHFTMETVGQPSRWNTLRALRVLRHFGRSPQAT